MAFELLPSGTILVKEHLSSLSWSHGHEPSLRLQADGKSVQSTPADPRWPFRGLAYAPERAWGGRYGTECHYPVAGDAQGRAGYDPDWALLVMLENDGLKNLRIREYMEALAKADPMTAYPDPEGPGYGLPLPFAILAKARSTSELDKAFAILSKFPPEVCKAARWNGLNLAEFQVSQALGRDVPGGREARDERGRLVLAAWLVAQFGLPLADAGVCHDIVACGFFYNRNGIELGGLGGPLCNALWRIVGPRAALREYDWRVRSTLLDAAAEGLAALPGDVSIDIAVRRWALNQATGRSTLEAATLRATPANAAALFALPSRLPALLALGAGADGQVEWEGLQVGHADETPLLRCAQWLYEHASPQTRERVMAVAGAARAASKFAPRSDAAGKRRLRS